MLDNSTSYNSARPAKMAASGFSVIPRSYSLNIARFTGNPRSPSSRETHSSEYFCGSSACRCRRTRRKYSPNSL